MSNNVAKLNNSSASTTTNQPAPGGAASNGRPANSLATGTSNSTPASKLKGGGTSSNSSGIGGGIKVNNNERAAAAGHRRDNSNVSATAAAAHAQLQAAKAKEARLYQYAQPQTHFQAEAASSTPSDDLLAYADGKLVSGTLDSLITHMVPTADYYPDYNYLFAFLLSARLFIRPHELLNRIDTTWELQQQQQLEQQQHQVASGTATDEVDDAHAAYTANSLGHMPSPLMFRKLGHAEKEPAAASEKEPGAKSSRSSIQRSAQNCIRLLSEWIETFPYDFRDERLMQQVRILARKCVFIDNALGKHVSRILQMLVQRLTALEKYEDFLQMLAIAADANGAGPSAQHYGTSASASYSSSSSGSSSTGGGGGGAGAGGGISNAGFSASVTVAASSGSGHHGVAPNASGLLSSSQVSSSASDGSTESPNSHDVYGIMDICGNCAHMAHQLTAIELERLSHIGPEEFVQAFAKEYNSSMANKAAAGGGGGTLMSTSAAGGSSAAPGSGSGTMNASSLNDIKKTRNLESYVEWFNRLSYLTASEIVKYPKKKQRVRVIEFWIETARECFNSGNFNSLMAIIAGLNLAPISRLKKTWSKVQSAKFSVLEHQMDPTSNFNSYRSTLKAAVWRSEYATDERERIIIPFFSLFVKDLYFLNEGCSNRLPNNHINFEKCSQLAKQIMEFNEWKKVSCPYEKLPHVIAYLQNSPVLNENTLSMASFECETPENTEEKDRYKTVKAEKKQAMQRYMEKQQQKQQQHFVQLLEP